MNEFTLKNVRLVQPDLGIRPGYVVVSGGVIAELDTGTPEKVTEPVIDGGGRRLTPGLIDVHQHGVHTFCYDNGPDDLIAAAGIFPRYGVTGFVANLVPKGGPGQLDAIANVGRALPDAAGATALGIHLEGPFVAITGAACETRDGDVAFLDELLDACMDRARVMSISPEVRNITAVIERLVERNVTPFITHTRASVEETLRAIDAGARHATHFYDVFPAPPETDPGVRPVGAVETILADDRTTCDFICDGIHVHPMAIRAAVAAMGWQRVSLITDSSFGAGLPPGDYDTPWGYPVRILPGGAPRIAEAGHPFENALAGSALTMNRGISNLLRWLDLPEEHVWAMGTRNPAAVIDLPGKGTLAIGADADFVLWDEIDGDYHAHRTWAGGACVYEADTAKAV